MRVLAFQDGQLRNGLRFLDALRPLASTETSAMLGTDGRVEVPLQVPTHQERDRVVAALLEQVRVIINLLPRGRDGSDGGDVSDLGLMPAPEDPLTPVVL